MTLCKICNINKANQTGAHIFPAWMIASAFDEEVRNRDYEVIHNFYAIDNKLPFFGRSVKPEKIIENIGRELSEEETKSQKNSLLVDNLWCRKCEKKMKIVEDYFLEKVDKMTIDFSECKGSDSLTMTVNCYVVRLFLYSLIFRASVSAQIGFKLDEKVESKLKSLLNNYLKENLDSTLELLKNSKTKNELLAYPIRCIKVEAEEGKTSNPVYIHEKYDKPYCFIINRYILQFFTKESHMRSTPFTFFGISEVISKMENIINLHEVEFRIGMFDLEVWGRIKENFVKYHSHQKVIDLSTLYKEIIYRKFGKYPSEAQIKKFLNVLIQNNEKLGVKYTTPKIVNAINKSLK